MQRTALQSEKRPCGECGTETPLDELVHLGSTLICGHCKPRAVSKIREGAPLGGAHRIQPHVHRDRVRLPAGTVLPNRCVLCNAPAQVQLRHRYSPNFPLWLLPLTLAPFLGLSLRRWAPQIGLTGGTVGLLILVGAVILHPLSTPRPPVYVAIPLCENHHRARRLWLFWASVVVGLGVLGLGLAVLRFRGHAVPADWLYGPAFLIPAGALAIWARLRVVALEMMPATGPHSCLQVRGTGSAVRASLARVDD